MPLRVITPSTVVERFAPAGGAFRPSQSTHPRGHGYAQEPAPQPITRPADGRLSLTGTKQKTMPPLTTTESTTGQHTASRTTTQTTPNAANRLRTTMAAVRLSFTWLGVRKTLAPDQRTTAARLFHTDRELLSARMTPTGPGLRSSRAVGWPRSWTSRSFRLRRTSCPWLSLRATRSKGYASGLPVGACRRIGRGCIRGRKG